MGRTRGGGLTVWRGGGTRVGAATAARLPRPSWNVGFQRADGITLTDTPINTTVSVRTYIRMYKR